MALKKQYFGQAQGLHQRMMNSKSMISAAVCHECGGYFTPMGLRMHEGSRKCAIRKESIPLKKTTDTNLRKMDLADKESVVANIATAIERRGLSELTGLEISETKLVLTDQYCETKNEYWVHKWVKKLWSKYADEGYTRKFYAIMEKLLELPQEERESEIGLILLGLYDDQL